MGILRILKLGLKYGTWILAAIEIVEFAITKVEKTIGQKKVEEKKVSLEDLNEQENDFSN